MTSKECDVFLASVLEVGKGLVESGAEIHRVEDTINRICTAYGFENCNVYAVSGMIVATIEGDDQLHYTQSVRVTSFSTDLGRMEELNALSRKICKEPIPVEEFKNLVYSYKKPKSKPIIKCIGYMLAAGGFAVFFGGNWFDGVASATIAIVIYLMDYNLNLKRVNNVIYAFFASFVSGCLALIFVHFGFGVNVDKVMIGDIMLFIPGLLLVSSVKEMFNRDIVTGLYRLIEAVLVAVSIAFGFAVSYIILGGAVQ